MPLPMFLLAPVTSATRPASDFAMAPPSRRCAAILAYDVLKKQYCGAMVLPSAPRRGRPPKLSRDRIVRDVAEMLLSDPTVPLTLARVADAIGVAPMSLYPHFADRDDLVKSVAHHL